MTDSTVVVVAERHHADAVTTTNSNSNSNSNLPNVRSLAQQIATWYLDRRDPYQSHSANVHQYLRTPLTTVTVHLLPPPPPNVPSSSSSAFPEDSSKTSIPGPTTEEDPTNGTPKDVTPAEKPPTSDRWKHHVQVLTEASSSWSDWIITNQDEDVTKEEVLSSSLDVRSRARLDAFLDGVARSVVSDPPLLPRSDAPVQRPGSIVDRTTDLSLMDGLQVGFRSLSTTRNVLSSLTTSNKTGSSSSRPSSATSTTTTTTNHHKSSVPKPCPQLGESELVTRIELYLRSISRVVTYGNDCVIEYEPNRALKARTKFLVAAFVNTVGTVRHVNPVLTRLLVALTKELLAVPTLSEDLMRIVRNMVSNYVHATSFASLAFLSSPESSADQRLTPALLKYLLYLQQNWPSCERDCDIELMLSTVIDPQLRQLYKTAEFQSIGHLLEVYQSHRHLLQNIAIPPRVERQSEAERIGQAMKDISREVIAVNGSVLPRITNRFDLIQLLTSALNLRPLYNEGQQVRRQRRRGDKKKKGNKKSLSDSPDGPLGYSGNEADSDSNYNALSESSMYDTDGGHTTDDTTGSQPSTTTMRRKYPTTAIVDLLAQRLLLAVSRTGTMGDAYFVVCDLFGGEDVEVVQSAQQHLAGMSNASGLVHYHQPTTIDLHVRLSSVTIKSHASFDVYPKSMVGDCEPLIQIHATTTETIALQEIRSIDDTSSTSGTTTTTTTTTETPSSSGNDHASSQPKSDRILLERTTETTGYRFLSIRPALYEKVSVWHNTPS